MASNFPGGVSFSPVLKHRVAVGILDYSLPDHEQVLFLTNWPYEYLDISLFKISHFSQSSTA